MMEDAVIRVEGLSKKYRIGEEQKSETLASLIKNVLLYPIINFRKIKRLTSFNNDEDASIFWALSNVNFEVKRGEVLGIIGHNGAGKSTLLKILSQITEPSGGRVVRTGKVSSLLEVGTGFHPELSGLDNIYMNGTILGMTKDEIDDKLDHIIEFSGVSKHINTPVKFYSSGMRVRLAFSVAAHLEPDILIIDEVLAVGDAEFQKKCLGKMESVASDGRTVLFVSHNMAAVEGLCSRVICLDQGVIAFDGKVREGINHYLALGAAKKESHLNLFPRTYEQGFTVESIKFKNLLVDSEFIKVGDEVIFEMKYSNQHELQELNIAIHFSDSLNNRLFSCSPNFYGGAFKELPKKGSVSCKIPRFPLPANTYSISVWVLVNRQTKILIDNEIRIDVVEGDFFGSGNLPKKEQRALFYLDHEWFVGE